MRRGARQSQIVNNFFTFVTIVIMSVVLTFYVKYIVKEDKPTRINSGLVCQQNIKTTDRIFNQNGLKIGLTLLNKGFYLLDGGVIPAINKKSLLAKKLDLSHINNIFLNTIAINLSKDTQRFLKIKYELIESDEETSNHAGTLLSSFRVNNKEVFRMSTDFAQYDINEITQRIECTMEAFKYNATK